MSKLIHSLYRLCINRWWAEFGPMPVVASPYSGSTVVGNK